MVQAVQLANILLVEHLDGLQPLVTHSLSSQSIVGDRGKETEEQSRTPQQREQL
jgi:hypothetical protein